MFQSNTINFLIIYTYLLTHTSVSRMSRMTPVWRLLSWPLALCAADTVWSQKSSTQRPWRQSQTHWTSNMHTYSYTCDCSDSWPKNEHSGIIYSPLSFSKPVWLLFYFRTQEKLFSSMSRLFFCTRYCTLLWRFFYVHVYVFYQSLRPVHPKTNIWCINLEQ